MTSEQCDQESKQPLITKREPAFEEYLNNEELTRRRPIFPMFPEFDVSISGCRQNMDPSFGPLQKGHLDLPFGPPKK